MVASLILAVENYINYEIVQRQKYAELKSV